METDASNYAYRAILPQKKETEERHLVAFMLKSMAPAKRNYNIRDKEMLAVVKPLEHWRHWLEGTKLLIEIITNHKNLVNFSNPQILNQRQVWWLWALQKYNFVLGWRLGKQNSAANALSHQQDLMPPNKDPKPMTLLPLDKFVELDIIAADNEITTYLDAIATDNEILEWIQNIIPNDLQYKEGRILVPEDNDIRRDLLKLYHNTLIAGHPGITGTYELIGRMYTWPKMKEYVTAYVQGCSICAKAKRKNVKEQGKLQPLPNPMTPWYWTKSDLIGLLPKSKGKDAVYVVVGRFTKYAYFVACNTTETAKSLAHLHAKHVWSHEDRKSVV